jgi:hypothetical protein
MSPGTPLVEQHGALAAMPLDADEAFEVAAPGTIVMAHGGVAEAFRLQSVPELDLGNWIDLASFQIVEPTPLAAAPVRAAIPPSPVTDIRSLTGAPAADAGAKDVITALTRARAGNATGHVARSFWRRFARWVSEQFPSPQRELPPPSRAEARSPSVIDRLRARIAGALWKSRLGMVLGRRHAAYLRRLLELFDRGELEQALRHAIPIGGGHGDDAQLRIGVPRPRENLSLTFSANGRSSIIPVADMAMAMMRDRYRAAATRLEQSNRIDEAAFVFAELLGDVKAAISLLERHGRYALAARLGEGRGIEPGMVVRLWFLAGDRQRAIDTARKYQAWVDAVARLERSGDEQAAVLRMLWADHLAATGDFVRAVEAAWPVKPSRALVEAWIDRGIATEGRAAARMLVKKLVVAPSSFPVVAPALLGILGATHHDGPGQRVAMIEELVASPGNPELQTIARPALRALLRDCGAGAEGTTAALVERLSKFTDDAALRADRPIISAAPKPSTLIDRTTPLELHWSAHDAGVIPIYDAALLPGDRILLALGELGVRIIGRTGRTVAHIDQPATKLVVSDHGTRALAIAARGQVQRVAHIDLIERRGAYWCDAEFDNGASTFDGDLWIATRGREVFAVDTTASRWRAVWGIEVDPATAHCSIRRDGRRFVIAARDGEELQHWYYDGFTLRARRPWQRNGVEYVAARPGMTGGDCFVVRDAQVAAIELSGYHAVASRRTPTGMTLTASHLAAHKTLGNVTLDGATSASIRLTEQLLTIGDDRGRAIVVDLETGVTQRELRTT